MSASHLCRVAEVPDGGARVIDEERGGRPVVAVRRGQKPWAYVNRHPHFSVPLDFEPANVSCYRAQILMCTHYSVVRVR